MAHLDLFIREIITGAVAAKTPHQAEIDELTRTIDAESEAIRSDYSRIGELYVEQASGEQNDTELGKLVAGVKASQKKIKESKLKIGELMGKNFCESCCEEVDDDALYCNNCGAKMPVKLMPGMVLCPHCNKAVREGIRFCTNCGGSMVEEPKPEGKVCPNCGWETTDMEKMFCDKCGRRLEGGEEEKAAEEEVKVATHKVCPNCGWKVYDIETMFCDECGRILVEESELKNAE